MNDLSVFIYFLCFAAVAGATFAFMWRMTTIALKEANKPIKRSVHPEMQDVKSGEQLLVFKTDEDEDDEDDVIIIRK